MIVSAFISESAAAKHEGREPERVKTRRVPSINPSFKSPPFFWFFPFLTSLSKTESLSHLLLLFLLPSLISHQTRFQVRSIPLPLSVFLPVCHCLSIPLINTLWRDPALWGDFLCMSQKPCKEKYSDGRKTRRQAICLSFMCWRETLISPHLGVYAVSSWLLYGLKPPSCQNNPIIHLMATRCRLCFVRLDRCYDEPSGAVMDMLQAFAVTRRSKNAHIHTKYTQNM